jgi:hypothetical protein
LLLLHEAGATMASVDIEVTEGDPGELGHEATAAEIELAAQTRHHRRCKPPPAPVVCGILYPLVLDSVRAAWTTREPSAGLSRSGVSPCW